MLLVGGVTFKAGFTTICCTFGDTTLGLGGIGGGVRLGVDPPFSLLGDCQKLTTHKD